jgi:hypothetical protein
MTGQPISETLVLEENEFVAMNKRLFPLSIFLNGVWAVLSGYRGIALQDVVH